mmetsp:Transcript_17381/g.19700  ORF Transcript_17381/g.19700 Transcript_17381/m.19700 type:complete len:80 (+) Transcript_17381:264-503(+)
MFQAVSLVRMIRIVRRPHQWFLRTNVGYTMIALCLPSIGAEKRCDENTNTHSIGNEYIGIHMDEAMYTYSENSGRHILL